MAGAIEEAFGNACVAQASIEGSNKDVSHGLALCDHEPGLATSFTEYKFDVRSEFGRIARSGHPAGLTSQFYDPLFSIGLILSGATYPQAGRIFGRAPDRHCGFSLSRSTPHSRTAKSRIVQARLLRICANISCNDEMSLSDIDAKARFVTFTAASLSGSTLA